MIFKNRVSTNPDRRRLTIVSQNSNEIVADVTRADQNVTEEGTPLTAEVFNLWDETVSGANAKAAEAKTVAQSSVTQANDAKRIASGLNDNFVTFKDGVNTTIEGVRGDVHTAVVTASTAKKQADSVRDTLYNLRSPMTGKAVSLQQAIDDIFNNLTYGVLCSDYDNLNMTAQSYDAKNMTAYSFDTKSKLLLL